MEVRFLGGIGDGGGDGPPFVVVAAQEHGRPERYVLLREPSGTSVIMYDPASMSDASAATLEELSRLVRARGGARVGNLLPVSVPDNVQVRALTKAEFDALKQLVGAAE